MVNFDLEASSYYTEQSKEIALDYEALVRLKIKVKKIQITLRVFFFFLMKAIKREDNKLRISLTQRTMSVIRKLC